MWEFQMKSVNKSIIAVVVFSALFTSLAPAARAANVDVAVVNQNTNGGFIISGIDSATYDLQNTKDKYPPRKRVKRMWLRWIMLPLMHNKFAPIMITRTTCHSDEQYDGRAIIKNRDDIATNKANQKIVDNDQNVLINTNGGKADTALQRVATNQSRCLTCKLNKSAR